MKELITFFDDVLYDVSREITELGNLYYFNVLTLNKISTQINNVIKVGLNCKNKNNATTRRRRRQMMIQQKKQKTNKNKNKKNNNNNNRRYLLANNNNNEMVVAFKVQINNIRGLNILLKNQHILEFQIPNIMTELMSNLTYNYTLLMEYLGWNSNGNLGFKISKINIFCFDNDLLLEQNNENNIKLLNLSEFNNECDKGDTFLTFVNTDDSSIWNIFFIVLIIICSIVIFITVLGYIQTWLTNGLLCFRPADDVKV